MAPKTLTRNLAQASKSDNDARLSRDLRAASCQLEENPHTTEKTTSCLRRTPTASSRPMKSQWQPPESPSGLLDFESEIRMSTYTSSETHSPASSRLTLRPTVSSAMPDRDVSVKAGMLNSRDLNDLAYGRLRMRIWIDKISSTWALEIIALTVSGISLMAIIMLLMAHHGKVLPSWPVSISSTVSILGTIASLSMIFVVSNCVSQLKWIWFAQGSRKLRDLKTIDRASRGVSGAMTLVLSRNVYVKRLLYMFYVVYHR